MSRQSPFLKKQQRKRVSFKTKQRRSRFIVFSLSIVVFVAIFLISGKIIAHNFLVKADSTIANMIYVDDCGRYHDPASLFSDCQILEK